MIDEAVRKAFHSIDRAFDGVTLGEGTGLQESAVMFDLCGHATTEDRQIARQSDELNDWRRIPDEDIDRNSDGLYKMDSEGLRFHLPVYMLYFLRQYKYLQEFKLDAAGWRLCDPICADRLRDYLTDQQTSAIIDFLNVYLVLGDEGGGLDTDDVRLAIRMWRGDSEAANQLRGSEPIPGEEQNFQERLLARKRGTRKQVWDHLKVIFSIVMFVLVLYRLLAMKNGQWWWFNLAAVVCIAVAICLMLRDEFKGGNSGDP